MAMIDFSNYKFRCSALGKIVSKSGKFTDGNKTYIEECFIGELYGVNKEAYGRALEKGKHCEEDGITMLNKTLLRNTLIIKNKERKYNDFIHGECDVVKDGIVYDIKNAYDLFTFGKADLTHEYFWQLIGYMWLWECKKATLFYCINNMPEHLLIEEERMLFYKNKWKYISFEDEQYLKDCEELRKQHIYDHISLEERFKSWDIELTDQIENLKIAINKARIYMNTLYNNHLAVIANNKFKMGNSVLK